jgi:hypothetical protein
MKTDSFVRRYHSFFIGGALLLVLLIVVLLSAAFSQKGPTPTTFGECAALYPVKEGFPQTCSVPFGKTFVQYNGNVPQVENDIHLINLPPAPVITASPFTFSGEANQSWFSGGGLTAELVAGNGDVIGTATAVAQPGLPAEQGFTSFSVSISFSHPASGTEGALVLKDGASGTTALVIPVAY